MLPGRFTAHFAPQGRIRGPCLGCVRRRRSLPLAPEPLTISDRFSLCETSWRPWPARDPRGPWSWATSPGRRASLVRKLHSFITPHLSKKIPEINC